MHGDFVVATTPVADTDSSCKLQQTSCCCCSLHGSRTSCARTNHCVGPRRSAFGTCQVLAACAKLHPIKDSTVTPLVGAGVEKLQRRHCFRFRFLRYKWPSNCPFVYMQSRVIVSRVTRSLCRRNITIQLAASLPSVWTGSSE